MTTKKTTAELLREREDYPFGKPRPYTPDHPDLLKGGLPGPHIENVRPFSHGASLTLVALAISLAGYGLYGLLLDDLYVPTKRSPGTHFHGASAWLMFGMIMSMAGALLTVAFCEFDVARRRSTHGKLLMFLSISAVLFMSAALGVYIAGR